MGGEQKTIYASVRITAVTKQQRKMKKFTEKISLRLKHYYYCYFVTKVTVMFNDDELKGNVGFYDKCTLFLHGTRKKVIFYEEMEI